MHYYTFSLVGCRQRKIELVRKLGRTSWSDIINRSGKVMGVKGRQKARCEDDCLDQRTTSGQARLNAR